MKLFTLVSVKKGKETVYMTDSLPKVKARKKALETSQRKQHTNYNIRPANEGEVKYRRPPSFNFDPSGDTENYRKRKAKAKRIKQKNPREKAMIQFTQDAEITIVDEFNEENDTITQEHPEIFRKNEEIDADVLSYDQDTANIEFANGSLALGVPRNLFREKLEVNFKYDFQTLKAGDKFAWNGTEYEKISGNYATRLHDNKQVEIPEGTSVFLYELG
jgi:hypothetical protein